MQVIEEKIPNVKETRFEDFLVIDDIVLMVFEIFNGVMQQNLVIFHADFNRNNGHHDRRNFYSTDIYFIAPTKPMKLANDVWMCNSEACGQYC
jgi:hypothetical protein